MARRRAIKSPPETPPPNGETWTDFTDAGRNALAVQYKPLAHKIARQFEPAAAGVLDSEELASAALYGVVRASRGYKPGRGAKFITYATYCIRNEVIEEIRRANRRGFRGGPKRERVPDPTAGSDVLGRVIERSHPPPVHWTESEWASVLQHALPRERAAILLHYHGDRLADVGNIWGVSRERARQLVESGLRRIRDAVGGGSVT